MAYEVHDGYQKFQDKEPLILEPEDWSFQEWATICKLCGLPLGQTERIVLHADEMECFVDLSKKTLDSERTYTVTEMCPHCESEVEMRWDTDTMGFKAFCPVCGNRLMLCDECRHTEEPTPCDYDGHTDTCHRNLAKAGRSSFLDRLLDSLPHEPRSEGVNDDPGFWTDGEEILCPSEAECEVLAEFLTDALREVSPVTVITGWYDPAEDERNGERDDHTGFNYIRFE